MERLAALAHALLARAERAEVLDGLGHDVAVQAHDDAARGRAADGRDSWKVTAVQTLDLCLIGDLGLSRRHSSDRCGEKCETRHDLFGVQC